MNPLIIGNIISFAGALTMVLIGLIKNKNKILIAQCGQFTLFGTANIILGGPTGAISNAISILRNLISIKFNFNVWLKTVFIIIEVGLGAWFNNLGLIGWFPIISTVMFTLFLDHKNVIVIKLVIILSEVLWMIYDFSIQNYASIFFDFLCMVTTSFSIIQIKKANKNNESVKVE